MEQKQLESIPKIIRQGTQLGWSTCLAYMCFEFDLKTAYCLKSTKCNSGCQKCICVCFCLGILNLQPTGFIWLFLSLLPILLDPSQACNAHTWDVYHILQLPSLYLSLNSSSQSQREVLKLCPTPRKPIVPIKILMSYFDLTIQILLA